MTAAPIRHETLPSGLQILTRECHTAPVAELQIWVDVGSADERDGEAGLAHFHEHMLFKGTATRGIGEIAGEIEGCGGRINAHTSYDNTVYHATLPSREIGSGLDVLADAILHSSFDPAEIAREIEVVLEEISRSEDDPSHVLSDLLFATRYAVHPYRAPILGTRESVASFDRARVRAFTERWYRAEHLCVVAAGDFDAEWLHAEIRRRFAELAPGAARRMRPDEPPQQGLRVAVLERPFERANLELAWPAMNLAHPTAAHADLLAFILGNGDSSRLVRQLEDRRAEVEHVDAGCYTPLDPGLFTIGLETSPERLVAALGSALREVGRVRNEPVSAEELERARTNFLALEDFERESVSGIAQKLGGFHHLAGDFRREQDYLEAVRRASPEDLLRSARELLDPQRLSLAAVVPTAEAGRLARPVLEAALAEAERSTSRAFARSVGREVRPRSGILRFPLSGGGQLHLLARREVPVVSLRAAFLGGQLSETADCAGHSAFLASLWLRGTQGRSAADFARSGEALAAHIDSFSGRNSIGMTLDVPAAHFEAGFDLLAEALLEPAFADEEIEHERRNLLAAIARNEDQLSQRVFELFAQTHYRQHPYRQPLLGTRASIEAADAKSLARRHDLLVRASGLSIAVVGDVDPERAAAHVAARLAELAEIGEPFALPAEETPPREIRSAELHKARAQTHLLLGFRGLSVRDPDRHALDVLAQVLAGQGGRLFVELRDRRGLAYAVGATNLEGLAPGSFSVYLATAPEKRAAAEAGLFEALRALLQDPLPAAEIERAQRYLIGSFAIEQQRNATHASQLSLDPLYGIDAAAHLDYPERIAAITPAELLRVARRILDLDAYTLARIGP